MLLEYNRYIAYSCPVCGQTTKRKITPFNISGSKGCFLCGDNMCKNKIITIIEKKDKYIIEFLCAACGGTHRFTVSRNGFWRNDIIIINCPETMLDMIVVGTSENVDKNIKKQQEMYHKAEEELYQDPSLRLYFDIIGAVNDIAKSGNVACANCTKNVADIELIDDAVLITCRNCGTKKVIPVTEEAFKELSETGTIVLE